MLDGGWGVLYPDTMWWPGIMLTDSSQLFHLNGLQMLLNISFGILYYQLIQISIFIPELKYLNTSCLSSLEVRIAFEFELFAFIYKLVIWLTQLLNSLVVVQDVIVHKFHMRTSWHKGYLWCGVLDRPPPHHLQVQPPHPVQEMSTWHKYTQMPEHQKAKAQLLMLRCHHVRQPGCGISMGSTSWNSV